MPPLEKYVEYLKKIWETHWLTNDAQYAQLLAKKLEEYLKTEKLVLMNNGTLTIQTIIKALDLKGEVITTPFTFAATTNALLWEGLTPVFADIDPKTYNIDPNDVEKKITNKTSAILAVHVYGNPCDVKVLQEIADKHNLKLIYDAAHAFGVEYKNKPITDFGDASTLSFHATKVFNTIEGGAVIAKDPKVIEKLSLMRNHGIKSEEQVILPGTNAKMSEFHAIMGLLNLEKIDEIIELRHLLYNSYVEKLEKVDNISFQEITASKHNYSYMPILLESQKSRDNLYSMLLEKNVKSRKYFYPLTANFDYFKGQNLVEKYRLIKADSIANRILCLPLYPDLTMESVNEICGYISKYLGNL